MPLTFQPMSASDPQCAPIAIANDNILEADESFSVVLTSTDEAAMLNPSSASVTIIDNDGR